LPGAKEISAFKDKVFMQESVCEIKFSAPDKYEQKVIAFSNTFPNMNDPKMAMFAGMTSLYNPMLGNVVSPLNPKSFDYYRFRYEGFKEDNNQIINKIRIIPKLKDGRLMEGIIYIADNEWNIRHAEFTIVSMGLISKFKFNYHPVINDIYLVTTYEANLKFNLGINLEANFLSSIQFADIQLNDSLIAMQTEKIRAKKEKQKKRKRLEIKDDDYVTKTVDSLAITRDSLYWSEVRTVVLNEEELKSYVRKDSMQTYVDSLNNAERNPKFKTLDLLTGGWLGNDSSLLHFRYDGLLGVFPEYNFVDGFWLGQSVEMDFNKNRNTGVRIYPAAYWLSSRKTVAWEVTASLDYAPERLGKLQVSAGKKSEDFSGDNGMERLVNAAYSIVGGRNFARFYDRNHLAIFNQTDLFNGFRLSVGYETARRQSLENHTTWNIFGITGKWKPNIPDAVTSLNMQYDGLSQYIVQLEYTPEYYYRIHSGKKRYIRSRFPTFVLNYRQGTEGGLLGKNFSTFQQLELNISQEFKAGIFNRFNYSIIAGKFLNNNDFNYIDYKHFNIAGHWLTFKDWKNAYVLLPYYRFSTNKEWIQAFANYNTDYLILKRLSFLQGKPFTETLHAKFLHTPEKNCYSEWGYSIDFLSGMGRAGLFVAFDSFTYSGFGVQFSIPLFGKRKRNREITISIGN
jgi:hypothetical protein